MDLARTFAPEQFERALESWRWAGVAGKRPLFASPFGDVFFDADDGVWFLDLLEGTLTRQWPDAAALKASLRTIEGQDRYLLAGLAFAAERQGLAPSAAQVLGFKNPPFLGGAVAADNIDVIDFEVSLYIAGQLHRQVKELLPGTRISGFTVDGQIPTDTDRHRRHRRRRN